MDFHGENDPISTTQAQNNFGACLKKVLHTAQPVLVKKHGKPVAVLVDYRSWQSLTANHHQETDLWTNACQKLVMGMRRRKNNKQTPSVELLKQLRDER